MNEDPIEEIRARRRKLLREKYDGSVGKLIQEGMRWEKVHAKRTVALRPRQLASKAV